MFGDEKINKDDLPEEIRAALREAEESAKKSGQLMTKALDMVVLHVKKKAKADGIEPHELDNVVTPMANFMGGWTPVVIPFEIRDGGPNDGKRIIALCVQLPDKKTVMPMLQVADFDTIATAKYAGKEEIEIILPQDSSGIGWQKTVSETMEQYMKIHGGD